MIDIKGKERKDGNEERETSVESKSISPELKKCLTLSKSSRLHIKFMMHIREGGGWFGH